MTQHLSSQQILECLIGAGDPDGQRHARECAACRAEMENISKPLAWFRASVQHAGERGMRYAFATGPVLLLTPASLDRAKRAGVGSLLIHAAAIGLLFMIGANQAVQQVVREEIALIAPDIAAYKPAVKKDLRGGGGGGGHRSPPPASK